MKKLLLSLFTSVILSGCAVPASMLYAVAETVTDIALESNTTLLASHDNSYSYTFSVYNDCFGDDSTVEVYLNGWYLGDVYALEYFTVPAGTHFLEAYGTGLYGHYYSYTMSFYNNRSWYLC